MTITKYLERHKKDYGTALANTLSYADPLAGKFHMSKRKVVDRETNTVTLYNLEELNMLTWKCHICGDERMDAQISVRTNESENVSGVPVKQNVRYCNDRPECIEASKTFSFFISNKEVK
jgi:PHP family Zn ribbon phosphoesterase